MVRKKHDPNSTLGHTKDCCDPNAPKKPVETKGKLVLKHPKNKKPKACFVYGSLRPDDDSGQMWTK